MGVWPRSVLPGNLQRGGARLAINICVCVRARACLHFSYFWDYGLEASFLQIYNEAVSGLPHVCTYVCTYWKLRSWNEIYREIESYHMKTGAVSCGRARRQKNLFIRNILLYHMQTGTRSAVSCRGARRQKVQHCCGRERKYAGFRSHLRAGTKYIISPYAIYIM